MCVQIYASLFCLREIFVGPKFSLNAQKEEGKLNSTGKLRFMMLFLKYIGPF